MVLLGIIVNVGLQIVQTLNYGTCTLVASLKRLLSYRLQTLNIITNIIKSMMYDWSFYHICITPATYTSHSVHPQKLRSLKMYFLKRTLREEPLEAT